MPAICHIRSRLIKLPNLLLVYRLSKIQCPSPSGYTAQRHAIGKHSKLFSEKDLLKEYMTKKRKEKKKEKGKKNPFLVSRHVEIEENKFILQNRFQGNVNQ